MRIESRAATQDDLPVLSDLYRSLEEEMVALHPMWPLADGLNEPIEASVKTLLDDPDTYVVLGTIDGCPFGFMSASVEDLLDQAGGAKVGSIRLVFVDHGAREVGVGEAMLDATLTHLRARGITRFDAHVLPGHRLVKNFFESGGFSARSIVMHHDDER